MQKTWILCKRELYGYFTTPIAYVFIVIFLLLNGIFTFYLGNFFARGQAELTQFFNFHPWLYMIFIPAITMRLWAEERKSGTIELLLTLPLTTFEAVMGKFLAAWIFTAVALFFTFPIWLTVNYLGQPDNGVILAGYLGSLLLSGCYLAIGAALSTLTKNQIIAFIGTIFTALLFNLAGFPVVIEYFQNWVPNIVLETIASFGFVTNFEAISKGVLDLQSICYFMSLISLFLFINVLFIELKKAE